MSDDRPTWARRIRAERDARGWSQSDAVRAMRLHSDRELPGDASLSRRWKAWEAGDNLPDDFYRPLIARTFGTVTAAFFPERGVRDGNREILAATGMDTLDIVNRQRASDVDGATLDGLRITRRPAVLRVSVHGQRAAAARGPHLAAACGRAPGPAPYARPAPRGPVARWLARPTRRRVEYDMGARTAAESTRQAALSLGKDAGDTEIVGWAHEMRAWAALTTGDYRGVIAATHAGTEVAGPRGVTVQLAAQEAKAWARVGDRRQTEVALDRGRSLLERLEHPTNLDHHFVVDPSKFDFYAMDAYRLLGENRLAETYADEVIRVSTDFDGTERKPMRIAEARVTHGVIAAREGDVERAVAQGELALAGKRHSLPSLLMVSRELVALISNRYPSSEEGQSYLGHLRELPSPLEVARLTPPATDSWRRPASAPEVEQLERCADGRNRR